MLDKLRQMQRVEADPQVLANCLTVLMQVWGKCERGRGGEGKGRSDEGSHTGEMRVAGGTQGARGGPCTPPSSA